MRKKPKRELEQWEKPLRGIADFVFVDENGVKIRKPSDLMFYDPTPKPPTRRKRIQPKDNTDANQ